MSHIIFVKDIPQSIHPDEFTDLFAKLPGYITMRRKTFFAFVEFKDIEYATNAMRKYQSYRFHHLDRPLIIEYDKDTRTAPESHYFNQQYLLSSYSHHQQYPPPSYSIHVNNASFPSRGYTSSREINHRDSSREPFIGDARDRRESPPSLPNERYDDRYFDNNSNKNIKDNNIGSRDSNSNRNSNNNSGTDSDNKSTSSGSHSNSNSTNNSTNKSSNNSSNNSSKDSSPTKDSESPLNQKDFEMRLITEQYNSSSSYDEDLDLDRDRDEKHKSSSGNHIIGGSSSSSSSSSSSNNNIASNNNNSSLSNNIGYREGDSPSPPTQNDRKRFRDDKYPENYKEYYPPQIFTIDSREYARGNNYYSGRPTTPYLPPYQIYDKNACSTLFVSNLPKDVTERELSILFRFMRGFIGIRLVHREGRLPICFCDFHDIPSSASALEALNGFVMDPKNSSSRISIEFDKNRLPKQN